MKEIFRLLELKKNSKEKAIVCGIESITYSELYKYSVGVGHAIFNESSENIIIFMPNGIDYVVSFFAIMYVDKVVYPISNKSKDNEIRSAILRTDATVVLCCKETYERAKEATADLVVKVLCVEDIRDVENKCSMERRKRKIQNGNPVSVLLNTSGSTDIHKIVMLTEKGILCNCKDWIDIALEASGGEKMLVAMPTCTSFGTVVIVTCIMLGWTMVFFPTFFNSATLLKTIQTEEITHLICIGSMLNILAKDIEGIVPKNEYNSLNFIGIGGNKAVPQTIKTMMTFFENAAISPGYGITEATCIVTAITPKLSRTNEEKFLEKIESAGIPLRNVTVKIGSQLNCNTKGGEILVSGPAIMQGYYNDELKTKNVLEDGVLHTGDIGYFDEEGYLYIVGRIKNIIKTGGYTVFPEEVENILQSTNNVKEAYVYGIKDKLLEEKIAADIILIDENKNNIDEIKECCIDQLADYKVPEIFRIVSKIEKTKTGKIVRKGYK